MSYYEAPDRSSITSEKTIYRSNLYKPISKPLCSITPPTRYEGDYIKWLMELDAKRNTNWLRGTSTPKISNETRPHTLITKMNGCKNNFYNALYRLQLMNKQMQDVITGELHFGKNRTPNCTSVPLNEDTNWNNSNSALCASRFIWVYCSIDLNKTLELNENFTSSSVCTDLLRWKVDIKITNSSGAFNS